MIKLRNRHAAALSVFHPAEDSGSLHVDADQVVEVPGELVTDWSEHPELADQPDDCLITRTPDGDLRAWPLALWEHAADPPAAEQADTEPAVASTEAQMNTAPAVAPTDSMGPPAPQTSTEHPPAELFTPAEPTVAPAATSQNEG